MTKEPQKEKGKKDRKTYKAMANYINNTLGLSKEYVFEYIDKRIEHFIKRVIKEYLNSNFMYSVIKQLIKEHLTTKRLKQEITTRLVNEALKNINIKIEVKK